MADLKLGNQNENPQDLQQLETNLLGAIEEYTKATNNGQSGSKFLGGGNDYNIVAESVAVSKSNSVGMFATAMSESQSGPKENNTNTLFGGGGGNKRSRKLERLTSKNDAMGMPKSYGQKKDDARELARVRSGHAKKSKDPLAGGGSGLTMTGDKIAGTSFTKPTVSVAAVQSNPELVKGIGGGQLYDTLTATRYEKDHESADAVLSGAVNGDEQKQNALKNFQPAVMEQSIKKIAPSVQNTLKNQIKMPEPKPPSWAASSDSGSSGKSSS